ncbi:MAG TPA: NAD-dependent epimerase/dehydratase family protein [Chthoniobacterales bacterium]
MQVLITGGAGFIGSHLAQSYQGRAQVRVLDNLRTGRRQNLAGLDVEFIDGSILDRPVLRTALQNVDYVFHLAAMVGVEESCHHPRECVELNVIGLLNVLELAAECGVKKLCFSSSAAVYGDNPVVPKDEEMRPEPRSPYAVTKFDGEAYCEQFGSSGRLQTVSVRFFNVFGPRQDMTGGYGAVIPNFFRQALAGKPLAILGDGKQTRDFIYVDDIVSALQFVAQEKELSGTFNAGYGMSISILELAERILSMSGSKSKIEFHPARVGDVRHSVASVARLKNVGYRPAGSLDGGLEKMLAWLQSCSEAAPSPATNVIV